MIDDETPPSSDAPRRREGVEMAIVAATCVLVLLYFGRVVLVPFVLALILSLAITPLVRLARRLGLGQVGAVLITAAGLTVAFAGLGAVIAVQIGRVAAELPTYEVNLRAKAAAIERVASDRFREPTRIAATDVSASGGDVVAGLQARPADPTAFRLLGNLFNSVWLPVQTAGIVLVVLLFVTLEHEALRDRFIRLAGVKDLRATTAAINDAGERLSRFFVSQFAVNLGVGAVVGAGLAVLGFPHATLWAVLTAVLRFVPYVGVLAAALSAALLAAGVDSGWSLVALTLALYGVVELLATQALEPHLYGHTTGLSPLSVVVAAMFWGWLWGPIGLVVSTPMTLCLVVAGHHVKSLNFLNVLLGDSPALTLPQRFYQRALSGDADEIVASAREFLKRRSLAAYCDTVLMPALRLTRLDLASGVIAADQLAMLRSTIVRVVDGLARDPGKRPRRHRRNSILDDPNPGRHLRHLREEISGSWQGPLSAPTGSIVICVGLGSIGDDLATEILVRVLRDLRIDARHLSVEDLAGPTPPGAEASGVSLTCVVSISPREEIDLAKSVEKRARELFPKGCVIATMFAADPLDAALEAATGDFNFVAHSFEETAQLAIPRVAATMGVPALDAGGPPALTPS